MPYARIEIPTGLSDKTRTGILDAVDEVFVSVLGVPPGDAYLRLIEYRPELARIPKRHGPRFSFVEIQLFPGRSAGTKTRLYQRLVEAFAALGIPPDDLTIALIEIPQGDWGILGGQSGAQVDHGFKIAV